MDPSRRRGNQEKVSKFKCPGQQDVEKVMAHSKKCGGLLHARPRENIKGVKNKQIL